MPKTAQDSIVHVLSVALNNMSKVSKLARFFILGSKRHNQPLVNVVKLQGVITANTPSRSPQNRRTISPDKVDRWLQRAFSKRLDPVAVSIVINSPGGAPAASEMIFNKIRELSSETKIPGMTNCSLDLYNFFPTLFSALSTGARNLTHHSL